MSWRTLLQAVGKAAGAAASAVDSAIMPRCCVFCGAECEPLEAGICVGCTDDLPWNENACDGCAQPQQTPLVPGLRCASCQAAPTPFAVAAAPFRYAFPVDAAIKLLKFRRRLDYAPAFAAVLGGMLAALPADIDALLPVPLHWRRHALRGFNQADELCRELHKRCRMPVLRNVTRTRATRYQSGLEASERLDNLSGAFTVTGTLGVQHPLIVDDVITTGATCRALAEQLLQAGANRVSVLALARR